MTASPAPTAPPPSRRRRRLDDDDGVSLVEVMVAGFILTVALLGMASVASGTLTSVSSSQARQEATTAVTRALETARSLNYDQLAVHTDTYTAGELFDWDGTSGSADPEPYHATADGQVNSAYPFAESRTSYTLVTLVTEHQAERSDGVPVAQTARRVTAVATLTGGGEVRQSTVVARADRGLPLPAFSVSPVTASRVAVPDAATSTVAEACIASQLRNQGATDRYEITLPNPATHPSAFGYTIRVYLDGGTIGVRDGGDELLIDRTGNGSYLPDTPDPLDTNGTLDLLFCYQRTSYVAEETVTFPIRVHSLFDTDVHSSLSHEIKVTDRLVLYPLFDPGDDPLPKKASAWPLSTTAPTRTSYIDYEDDKGNEPGTYLEADKNDFYATFTGPLPPGATVGGTVTASMWVASHDSSAVGRTPKVKNLRLRYTLEVLGADGNPVASVQVTPAEFSHDGGGWVRQDVSFDLGSALPGGQHVVQTGDRLRLRVDCRKASSHESDCHIMYDTVATPASLVVPLR